MYGIIATWAMAEDGVGIARDMLADGGNALDAIEACVNNVEANPEFSSVGLGGLPNEDGVVEMDAAFMDGNTLSIGAVASIKDYLYPCSIARSLMERDYNNVLVSHGAEEYAHKEGFKRQNMLTEKARKAWQKRCDEVEQGLSSYIGHDTVCAIGLDQSGTVAACTSTSGLFFKKPGRVGDSPLPGCGFYADSDVGGACATGVGEELMKGVISYEIVRLMGQGIHPQKACETAILNLHNSLTKRRGKSGNLSVIAMDNNGNYGAAGNIDAFPFVVGNEQGVSVFGAHFKNGEMTVTERD